MPRSLFKLLWDTLGSGREIFADMAPSYDGARRLVVYHTDRRSPERMSDAIRAGTEDPARRLADQVAMVQQAAADAARAIGGVGASVRQMGQMTEDIAGAIHGSRARSGRVRRRGAR
ncbi:hypothetical protein ACFQ23_13290 [Schaalia naturae]|uniref:Uncharacterized protein n=1 Tax=Schaalia naturae TaxID=635203 RepID=A0ABW2SJB8_9ACTO